MTVLVGLRWCNGAVLACDSQETRANYLRFWPKVYTIEKRFVVLGAGNPTIVEAFARRFASKFSKAGNEEKIDRTNTIQLIENCLFDLGKEAGEDAVKGRQLLIAGTMDDSNLCLWAVDSDEIYVRGMRTWECYGSGIDAAEMLMKDFYYPEVSTVEAIPLLAYVVQAVSDICLDCGGPISVVVASAKGIKQLPHREVESSLSEVKTLLDRLRKEFPRRVLKGEPAIIEEVRKYE